MKFYAKQERFFDLTKYKAEAPIAKLVLVEIVSEKLATNYTNWKQTAKIGGRAPQRKGSN